MPFLYQYQQRADPLQPLSAPAETITPDKWLGEYPDRTARRPFAVALLVAGTFAPVAPPPPATVDQWDFREPVALRAAAPRQPGLSVVDPVLVPVEVDAWAGAWTQPQRVTPRQGGAFTVEPSPLRTVSVADWQGFDDYRRPAPRPDPRQWYAGPTLLVPSGETVTLDKWQGHWPQADRHVAPRQTAGYAGPAAVIPNAVPSVSGWYAQHPLPARAPRRAQPTAACPFIAPLASPSVGLSFYWLESGEVIA